MLWWKEEGGLLSLSLSQIDKRDLSYLAGTRVSGTRNSAVMLSDKFLLYLNLNDISDTHLMVNHSENFVDPYTEAHSNTTEGVWNAVGYPSKHWNWVQVLLQTGPLLCLGSKCLQMEPLLPLGPFITLVPFTRPSDRMRKKMGNYAAFSV